MGNAFAKSICLHRALVLVCVGIAGLCHGRPETRFTATMSGNDAAVAETNRAYAQDLQLSLKARQKVVRPVFLARNGRASPKGVSDSLREAALAAVEERLTSWVSGFAEFRLVASSTPKAYRLSFRIEELTQFPVDDHLQMVVVRIGLDLSDASGSAVEHSFSGTGRYRAFSLLDDKQGQAMVLSCVRQTVDRAIEQYAVGCSPTVEVVDTCQDGRFARIGIGRNYGLQPGQRVMFYECRNRRGLSGKLEPFEQLMGLGTVGAGGAPVGQNDAWVRVDDWDSRQRTVFVWTAARVVDRAAP